MLAWAALLAQLLVIALFLACLLTPAGTRHHVSQRERYYKCWVWYEAHPDGQEPCPPS